GAHDPHGPAAKERNGPVPFIPRNANMTMQRTPLLLSRLMERGPRLSPREEIVTRTAHGLHRQSYRTLRARASQVANALRAAGIGIGDRVASFQWNNHRHLELYYAVPSMGAVLHTL